MTPLLDSNRHGSSAVINGDKIAKIMMQVVNRIIINCWISSYNKRNKQEINNNEKQKALPSSILYLFFFYLLRYLNTFLHNYLVVLLLTFFFSLLK